MVWPPHQDHLRRVAGVDELNDQVVGSGDIALGKDDSGGGLGHGGLASVEVPGSACYANRDRLMVSPSTILHATCTIRKCEALLTSVTPCQERLSRVAGTGFEPVTSGL